MSCYRLSMTAEHDANPRTNSFGSTRCAIVASALFLAGCPHTVYAPATELPSLQPRVLDRSFDWPMIRTTSGELHKIQGEITSIRIFHGTEQDPIVPPFSASVQDDQLIVKKDRAPRTFALNDNPYLQIEYNDRKAPRVVGGITLCAVGTPLLIGGVAAFVEASESTNSQGLAQLAFPILAVVGVVGVGGGLGFWGGGIYFIAKDPIKASSSYATLAPTLQVGPQGVSFTQKF